MKNKSALLSFVIGMLSLILIGLFIYLVYAPLVISVVLLYLFLIIGCVASILAVIFGIIGIRKSKENGKLTFAIIGIIFGGLIILLMLYFLVMAIV